MLVWNRIQRTLIELKYGGGGVGELEGGRGSLSQLSQKQGLSAGESLSRLPYLGGELEQCVYEAGKPLWPMNVHTPPPLRAFIQKFSCPQGENRSIS